MTLTLNTIYLCLLNWLPASTVKPQATIVSEKSTLFIFSYKQAYVTKFDLAVK